jgi:hypothetical protein
LNRREERFDLDFESDASLKSSATAQNALIHGGITCNGKVKPYAWNRAAKIEDEVPGDVTTIGGSCHAGYADGYGAVSRFSGPLYVAATEDKVFVIDGKNRKVRAIDIAKMTKHAVKKKENKRKRRRMGRKTVDIITKSFEFRDRLPRLRMGRRYLSWINSTRASTA